MNKEEQHVYDLLDMLEEMIEESAKMPITGKTIIDRKEFMEVIDEIRIRLPNQLKVAERVVNDKDRIIEEAYKRHEELTKDTQELIKQNIENHDIVREAKIKANEIIALAQREAKTIRIGTRDYSSEILEHLDIEIEKKKVELITSMQSSFEKVARDIDKTLNEAGSIIRENIAELRTM